MASSRANLPRQVPIEAYGNGGFRFAGMSHKGSLLLLPTGVWDWAPTSMGDLDAAAFDDVIALAGQISYFILGTGRDRVTPPKTIREALQAAGIGLEAMDTGAATRTYNILLAEARPVAAALIAVD
jgi:uncharacterized protein